MERTKDLQRESRKENKQKKRKQEEIDSKRDEEDLLGTIAQDFLLKSIHNIASFVSLFFLTSQHIWSEVYWNIRLVYCVVLIAIFPTRWFL